jgi:hypothetical protein
MSSGGAQKKFKNFSTIDGRQIPKDLGGGQPNCAFHKRQVKSRLNSNGLIGTLRSRGGFGLTYTED